MIDDLILSDPAVTAKSGSLRRASLLFPIMSLFINIHRKNNFVWILGKGFTISGMSSAPSFHFTLTAAPLHIPLFCSSLQYTSSTYLALIDEFFLLLALILQMSKEEGNQFRNKYFWLRSSVYSRL